jgi:hypothetical protein
MELIVDLAFPKWYSRSKMKRDESCSFYAYRGDPDEA